MAPPTMLCSASERAPGTVHLSVLQSPTLIAPAGDANRRFSREQCASRDPREQACHKRANNWMDGLASASPAGW